MIKRNHIRYFLAVPDAGSFAQAATRLHITQPTLSVSIADLERLAGSRLFVRDRRHVRLTEAGGAFLPIARDLERGFRAADSFGRGIQREWPTLRFGVIRTVANPMLQRVVALLGQHFGIELIEGTDYELRTGLTSGRLQLALTLLRKQESGIIAHSLWTEPYQMLVSQSHRLADSTRVRPDELASEIMIARRSCEILEETSRFFTSVGVRPRFALRSDSDERCIAMVAAGLGITTAPRSLAVPGVVALDVSGYDFTRAVGLLHDPAWPAAADFSEVLAEIEAVLAMAA